MADNDIHIDHRVPYNIESWTLESGGILVPTESRFGPLSFPDRPPLVDSGNDADEIRVSFPKRGRDPHPRKQKASVAGHRRRSYSPTDSVSLNQHLRRGFNLSDSSFRSLIKSSDNEELKIRNGCRPEALTAIDRQEIARFHLQWLERRRRRRWLLKDASDSLLYSLNLYSESDLHQSPYPNL